MTLLPEQGKSIPDFPTLLNVTFNLSDPTAEERQGTIQRLTEAMKRLNENEPPAGTEQQPFPTINSNAYYTDILTALLHADLIHDPRLLKEFYQKGEAEITVSVNNTGPQDINLQQTYQNLQTRLHHLLTPTRHLTITFLWETIPNGIGEMTTLITITMEPRRTEWVINVSPVRYQQGTENSIHNQHVTNDLENRGIFTQAYGYHTPADPDNVTDARIYRTTEPIQLIKRSQTPLLKWTTCNPHLSPEEKAKQPDPNLNALYHQTFIENLKGYQQ